MAVEIVAGRIDALKIHIVRVDSGDWHAVMLVNALAHDHTALQPAFFHEIREVLFYLKRILNVFDIKIFHRLVGRIAVNGAGADDALPQGARQCEVCYAVKPYIVLALVQKTGIDEETVFCQCVFCKGPGKSQEIAFAVLPDQFCVFHFNTSFDALYQILYGLQNTDDVIFHNIGQIAVFRIFIFHPFQEREDKFLRFGDVGQYFLRLKAAGHG